MPHTTNIQDFQTYRGSLLVESYLILIAVELSLKDCGAKSVDSHDIPELLSSLLSFPKIADHRKAPGELNSHIAQLRSALSAIWCNDPDGRPIKVPSKSFPHLCYCRCYSEWDGERETKTEDIMTLNAACKNLREFLKNNKRLIGVDL